MTDAAALLDAILDPVAAWALARKDLLGLALVGSQACGTARHDSDIDLVLLTLAPDTFRSDQAWPAEIKWMDGVIEWRDVQYGSAWSRHIKLQPQCEVEFTFCAPSWATTNPLDAGTAKVVSGGCRILVDKAHLLEKLLAAATP